MCAYFNNNRMHDEDVYNRRCTEPNRMRSIPNVAQQLGWEQSGEPFEPNFLLAPNVEQLSQHFLKSQYYGSDFTDYSFDLECDNILNSLQLSPAQIDSLQRRTIGQSESSLWKQERRKRLTASYFGRIFKMGNATFRWPVVQEILFSTPNYSGNIAMNYGRENEPNAIADYEDFEGVSVQPCGLFVHPKYGYLGASPDGLIDHDGIVEVKCIYSAQGKSIYDIPLFNKRFCSTLYDGSLWLKTNHHYYYQIQGQLEVTGRGWCDFVLWNDGEMSVQRIFPDEGVWNEMFPKLETFYKQSLLPELVDSRFERGLPIREPDFVVEARERRGQRV